jgi:hypothetical protein
VISHYWDHIVEQCAQISMSKASKAYKTVKKLQAHKFSWISETLKLTLIKEYVRDFDRGYQNHLIVYRLQEQELTMRHRMMNRVLINIQRAQL